MREVILEEIAFEDEEALHGYLRNVLEFPEHYGCNLAALDDCLGDIDVPTRIVVRELAYGKVPAPWWEPVIRVMRRAAAENPFLDVIAYHDDLGEDEDEKPTHMSAGEAIARLKLGNEEYLEAHRHNGNISDELVSQLFSEGQRPYAVVIACSDSRVVPEHMFMTGLGELFTIRVAGNVVGEMEAASAAYACSHLHSKLLLVLGHTHCGAIESTMAGGDHGSVNVITQRIAEAIGDENDPYAASVLNLRAGIGVLLANPEIAELVKSKGLQVHGAVYHTHSGIVDFLD